MNIFGGDKIVGSRPADRHFKYKIISMSQLEKPGMPICSWLSGKCKNDVTFRLRLSRIEQFGEYGGVILTRFMCDEHAALMKATG